MNTSVRARHAARGFSMVELLVAIVLAGIIFGAMVPLFGNALKRTSGDNLRNTATNIAQDRIEQVRLLDYGDITAVPDNLNNPPSPVADFGDGRFGYIYTVAGSSKPYYITYTVVPLDRAQKVTVEVKWSDTDYKTTMQTIVKDPTAATTTATSGPTPTALPTTNLSITVSFKDYRQVNSNGVTVQRIQTNVTPNATFTPTPIKQIPNDTSTTVTWTGLTGGPDYVYTVSCHSQYIDSTSPPFHLLKNARLKFDTHPGGS